MKTTMATTPNDVKWINKATLLLPLFKCHDSCSQLNNCPVATTVSHKIASWVQLVLLASCNPQLHMQLLPANCNTSV